MTGNVNEAELNNNTELLNYEKENVFKNDFQDDDEVNNEKENLYEVFDENDNKANSNVSNDAGGVLMNLLCRIEESSNKKRNFLMKKLK